MKAIILLLLSGVLSADSNLALVFWGSKVANKNATVLAAGDMVVSGKEQRYGMAIRLPLSFVLGSSLELGFGSEPEQEWQYNANKIKSSSHRGYVINTLYPVSDTVSGLFGMSLAREKLECTAGCSMVHSEDKLGFLKARLGWHAGLQWLMPLVPHVDSGLRIIYNLSAKHKYCYGLTSCVTKFEKSSNDLELQLMTIASF